MSNITSSIKFFGIALILLGCNRKGDDKQSTFSSLPLYKIKAFADSCYYINDYANAKKYFSKAIELGDSVNGENFYKRGFSYNMIYLTDSSASDLNKSIKLNYRQGDAYFILGMQQLVSLNDSVAILYFESALKFKPKDQKIIESLRVARDHFVKNKKQNL
jgi:tetratricopeptide (TPR) repeat protein